VLIRTFINANEKKCGLVLHGMTVISFLFVGIEGTWLFVILERIFFPSNEGHD
jgi:hypothetical protein